jgi:membrane-associated HD superfamily phosphohydrolase
MTTLVGCLYGLVGLGSLVPFIISMFYGPPITLDKIDLPVLIWYAFPLLNSIVCFVIAYGLVTLRRWGRNAAMMYSGFWLAVMALGIAYSRLIEKPATLWTTGATVFVIVVGGFLIGVILLCLSERVKTLMSN